MLGVDATCTDPKANAKNVITVGAMNGAGAIANFSSFGPTDDGRIKRDLMAQGVNVLSTGAANNGATLVMSGTSMATPAVAGTPGLRQGMGDSPR
jgi:subtilisin family serine protease